MIFDDIESRLAELGAESLLRRRVTVDSPCGPNLVANGKPTLSFCSNDYLGLASEPTLIDAAGEAARRWGVGAGASHLVCGHMTPHELLERELAAFVGAERALFFSTGYMANLGLVPALVGRGDAVFADRLNHASLIDAARLSDAEHRRYPHGDLASLERMLSSSTAGRKLILTDAVFSMDGTLAPLPELFDLAERHDAWLVVDDAHGFGVLGPQGRGSLAHFGMRHHPRILYVGTLGKAAGVSGAFIAGSGNVIEWLMQSARTYVFTTASSPIVAATLSAGLKLIEAGEDRRQRIGELVECLRNGLAGTRWRLLPSRTAIQPIMIGSNEDALRIAAELAAQGIWVPAIRPPTVPQGTARLRVSLTAAHDAAQVQSLVDALRGTQ